MFRSELAGAAIAWILVFGIATDTRAQASDEARKSRRLQMLTIVNVVLGLMALVVLYFGVKVLLNRGR
jgi:type VI protein secretion system component VasF